MPKPLTFEREPAYLLHRRSYKERTYLVDFFTLAHGRFTALASFSSRLQDSHLQPFVPLSLSCSGGQQGKLFNVRLLEAQGSSLLDEVLSQAHGLYLNELLIRILPPHYVLESLFHLYMETLNKLSQQPKSTACLRLFEMGLLKAIGHELVFVRPDYHVKIDSQAWYSCGADGMLRRLAEKPQSSGSDWAYAGRTLLAMRDGLPDEDRSVLIPAERLLRQALDSRLGAKQIYTRDLLVQIQG